jgi:N-acetylmuramoyl-L-alanine amidase
MKVFLDAGHGGTDPGAVAKTEVSTLNEKDLTLGTVLRMKVLIEEKHPTWELLLSRDSDIYISPGARARRIIDAEPDAAISVHCNSSANAKATGHEVIYREDDDLVLADAINKALNEGVTLRDRGVKHDLTDLGRKLALLNTPGIPTVIVEAGFLSSEEDREVLLDFDKLSDILVKGIERWAEVQNIA